MRASACLSCLLLLTACGTRGPLYLPLPPATKAAAPAASKPAADDSKAVSPPSTK